MSLPLLIQIQFYSHSNKTHPLGYFLNDDMGHISIHEMQKNMKEHKT